METNTTPSTPPAAETNAPKPERRPPTVGMRTIKTATAAAICALIYFFFDRSPAFACIGAIFGLGANMEHSKLNGGNRLFGTIIGGFLGMGLYRIYLNISRREAYSFGDLLYFFSHQPDHVIVASFVLALINLVTSLPLAWFSFTSNMGNTTEEQMNWAVTYMLLTLLGFALNLLAAMPFTMSYYILSDNSDIKGVQALKASAKLMKGHYWEYMKMLLSFVPWIIFSIFTLYLALIWLVPYIETCMAVFYRNISGEFDEPPVDPYPPVTPIPQFHDETEA